jgi:general secretion pathway protein C
MLQVNETSRKSLWPAICALCALGASALAAYALVAWFLQIQSLSAPASQAPTVLSVALGNLSVEGELGSHVALALGAPKPAETGKDAGTATQAAHQWNLLGVVAGVSGQGSALIGVDGQAPKAFLPGQTVAPGWVLHSVGHKLARLAPSLQSAPSVTLELPK